MSKAWGRTITRVGAVGDDGLPVEEDFRESSRRYRRIRRILHELAVIGVGEDAEQVEERNEARFLEDGRARASSAALPRRAEKARLEERKAATGSLSFRPTAAATVGGYAAGTMTWSEHWVKPTETTPSRTGATVVPRFGLRASAAPAEAPG